MKAKYASSLILLTSSGKIILQKRTTSKDVYFSGCWGLIGGEALENENESQCIIRECFEETNWKPEYLVKLFTVEEHCIETVFFSEIAEVSCLECNEGESLKAFDYAEISDLKISAYHRGIINKFYKEYYKLDQLIRKGGINDQQKPNSAGE